MTEDVSDSGEPAWNRLHPAAALVRTVTGALGGVVFAGFAAMAASQIIDRWTWRLALALPAMVAGAAGGAWLGRARWRRTRWRLDERGFYVRRGWLWRSEVLIPRSRVQHLDLERGPLERHFGLASIVVHTAGSQTPALRQSGFAEADAIGLRDALIPRGVRGDDAL